MAYFEDLSPYKYDRQNENGAGVSIGWLSRAHLFSRGTTSSALLSGLRAIPITNLYRGWHICEFCSGEHGNGDLRVRSNNGRVFIAPALVIHYIEAHEYLPPQEFIDSVLGRGEEKDHASAQLHASESQSETPLAGRGPFSR